MIVDVDFTRPPTQKERVKLDARRHRLENPDFTDLLEHIAESMPGTFPETHLRLRRGFVFREKGIDVDATDRRAPAREKRPPATRLMESRSSALRFELTLLAIAQSKHPNGQHIRIENLRWSILGDSQNAGWVDVMATDAGDSHGMNYLTARDKRGRSVVSALRSLERDGLVSISDAVGPRRHLDQFALLNETGGDSGGGAQRYRTPRSTENSFDIPVDFVKNGWLHVLEDSEIAVLLMIACGYGSLNAGYLVAIPSEIRLRNYGIHRDVFSSARKTLEWFGLIEVEEYQRYDDGRAEDSRMVRPH